MDAAAYYDDVADITCIYVAILLFQMMTTKMTMRIYLLYFCCSSHEQLGAPLVRVDEAIVQKD